jgi:hypothetical protein
LQPTSNVTILAYAGNSEEKHQTLSEDIQYTAEIPAQQLHIHNRCHNQLDLACYQIMKFNMPTK